MTHVPVLLTEILELIEKNKIDVLVDCTYGGGGHSLGALLNTRCNKVVAIDRDTSTKLPSLENNPNKSINLFHDKFSNIDKYEEYFLNAGNILILADLGMSNLQLQDNNRSFSYRNYDSELDFRMGEDGEDIYKIINNSSEQEIHEIITNYGEEKYSDIISRNLAKNRPIKNVRDLVYIIRCSTTYGVNTINKAIARVFQAFRIYSNKELDELRALLEKCRKYKNSYVCIISFHSLEDRIVKEWMKEHCIKSKIIFPSYNEVSGNPQSRSAKARCGKIF